jgi:hypothetical protein
LPSRLPGVPSLHTHVFCHCNNQISNRDVTLHSEQLLLLKCSSISGPPSQIKAMNQ